MTPSQEAREYPPLPVPHLQDRMTGKIVVFGYTAEQMRSYVESDRKARQQDALDARRYRTMLANLHTLVLVTEKGSTLDLRAPQRGEQHSRKGTDAVLDGLGDAAIAKGERHE